jgi:hypothetical protein
MNNFDYEQEQESQKTHLGGFESLNLLIRSFAVGTVSACVLSAFSRVPTGRSSRNSVLMLGHYSKIR